MKLLTPIIAILALAAPAVALEHVTLTGITQTKAVSAGSLVEIIGTNKNNDGNVEYLRFTFADGASTKMVLRGKESAAYTDMKGNVFTGLTAVTLELANGAPAPNTSVTLKITPANEIGTTPAGAVLVLPENSTGDYDVVVESSDDLVNWQTVITQVVDGATSKNFFRARIIKKVAP
jgi:hypothetical protein